MTTFAAVTTLRCTAAISTIHLIGAQAGRIIQKIFRPAGKRPAEFEQGEIFTGQIIDGDEIIDYVVIGCEQKDTIAIHCHGNPIIIERVMQLLIALGAELLTTEQMLAKLLTADGISSAIHAEAKIACLKAVTLEGAKLIENQYRCDTGLAGLALRWLDNLDTAPPDDIHRQCRLILDNSPIAELLIHGAKVVIAGPPNSGKSTLLNCLCGRQKAVVTDTPGTTRDWVSAVCTIGPLYMELFDTAGLDQTLAMQSQIDKISQQRTVALAAEADLVLFVIDASISRKSLPQGTAKDKKILLVLNKSDIGCAVDADRQGFDFASAVKISAKNNSGIGCLVEQIRRTLGIENFDLTVPACFTPRQKRLIEKLLAEKEKSSVQKIITELLNAKVYV